MATAVLGIPVFMVAERMGATRAEAAQMGALGEFIMAFAIWLAAALARDTLKRRWRETGRPAAARKQRSRQNSRVKGE